MKYYIECNSDPETSKILASIGILMLDPKIDSLIFSIKATDIKLKKDLKKMIRNMYGFEKRNLVVFDIEEKMGISEVFKAVNLILKNIKYIYKTNFKSTFNGYDISDWLYDANLRINKIPTQNINPLYKLRTLIIFATRLKNAHERIKKLNPDSLILSHRIGYGNGIYSLIAEITNKYIITFGGRNNCAIIRSKSTKSYEYTLSDKNFKIIQSIKPKTINTDFLELEKRIYKGELNNDHKKAYANSTYSNIRLNEFLKRPAESKVGVYLHAFTDYPKCYLSSLGNSEIADYWKWLIKIFEIMKEMKNIDFILKEHPGSKDYPLRKDYLGIITGKHKLENVYCLRAKEETNINEIVNIGLTYIGSVAPELIALNKKNVIYTGEAPYSNFSFGIKVNNFKELPDVIENTLRNKYEPTNNEILEAQKYLLSVYKYLRVFKYEGSIVKNSVEKIVEENIHLRKKLQNKLFYQEVKIQ
jgi:hypothetical protein